MTATRYLASISTVSLLTLLATNVIATPLAPPVIAISATPPQDIPGGAPAASLEAAATFAWQEFIALNWPAKAGTRDIADTTQKFGAPGVQPLVWHTYRAKNEIFPGGNSPTVGPHGMTAIAPYYGYDAAPQYVYASSAGQIAACAAQPRVSTPAWINLDEVTQIALDSMYAGVVPAAPTPVNSNPQLIRFMAKANLAEYAYVVQNKFWYNKPGSPRKAALANFVTAVGTNNFPPAGSIISFPTGTFEVKAAFRPLTADEKSGQRFYTTQVRYYEKGANGVCFREDQWGLVALHIIQKTPSAPAFIYATFEQADNLLTTVNGATVPVEDENGHIVHPSSPATTPVLRYKDATTDPKSYPTVSIVGPDYCKLGADPHLFYRNSSTQLGLPSGGNICLNQRDHAIPSPIIAVNQAAHQAIAAYTRQNGIANSPWSYYKLVNVQAYPFNKTDIVNNPASPRNPATYYQANMVVETNYTLQNFDGALESTGRGSGASTGIYAPTSPPVAPPPHPAGTAFQNTYVLKQGAKLDASYNMGGCMGCHGAGSQTKGGDFSFLTSATPAPAPETPESMSSEQLKARFKALFPPTGKQ